MNSRASSHACDVLVIGGGIIGLTAAWRALEAGASVIVLDPSPGDGATHAAAGMLAPVMEAGFGEEAQARLGTASLALWPAYAEGLERAAGLPAGAVGLETQGTLALAYDGDDLVALRRHARPAPGAGARLRGDHATPRRGGASPASGPGWRVRRGSPATTGWTRVRCTRRSPRPPRARPWCPAPRSR